MKRSHFLAEENMIFTSNAILFSLGSYAYSFEASYDHSNLTESEIAALDSAIQASLLELVYPVVNSLRFRNYRILLIPTTQFLKNTHGSPWSSDPFHTMIPRKLPEHVQSYSAPTQNSYDL